MLTKQHFDSAFYPCPQHLAIKGGHVVNK